MDSSNWVKPVFGSPRWGLLRVQFAGGLGPFRPSVQLAAGEDHLVDLVGAVGEAEHAAEASEGGKGSVVGYAIRRIRTSSAAEGVTLPVT